MVIVEGVNLHGIIIINVDIDVDQPHLDLDLDLGLLRETLTVRKYNFLCQLKYNSPSEENYI